MRERALESHSRSIFFSFQQRTRLANMEILFKELTEEIVVPEARLYGPSNWLTNIYRRQIEEIVLPQETLPPQTVSIGLIQKRGFNSIEHLRPKPYRQIRLRIRQGVEQLRNGEIISIPTGYIYDARHIDPGNIAHIVHDHIGSLGYIKAKTGIGPDQVTVILPTKCPGFSRVALELCGYRVINTDCAVSGSQLELTGSHLYQRLPYVRAVRTFATTLDLPERIYIARKDSRRLLNESEIERILLPAGFKKIFMEDYSMSDQWMIAAHAKMIVGIHGAALSALAWKTPAATDGNSFRLLELFNPTFVVDCYRKYCAVLKGDWVGCRGRLEPKKYQKLEQNPLQPELRMADFQVDIEAFKSAFSRMLEGSPQ